MSYVNNGSGAGSVGFKFSWKDEKSLGKTIKKAQALSYKELEIMGKEARKRFEKEFTIAKFLNNLEKVLIIKK